MRVLCANASVSWNTERVVCNNHRRRFIVVGIILCSFVRSAFVSNEREREAESSDHTANGIENNNKRESEKNRVSHNHSVTCSIWHYHAFYISLSLAIRVTHLSLASVSVHKRGGVCFLFFSPDDAADDDDDIVVLLPFLFRLRLQPPESVGSLFYIFFLVKMCSLARLCDTFSFLSPSLFFLAVDFGSAVTCFMWMGFVIRSVLNVVSARMKCVKIQKYIFGRAQLKYSVFTVTNMEPWHIEAATNELKKT